MKTAFLLLLLVSASFADDVLLKDGTLYKNVDVIAMGEDKIVYRAGDGKMRTVSREVIAEIIESPFDPEKKTHIGNAWEEAKRYALPNLSRIAFSIPAAVLAADYFRQMSAINRQINQYESLGMKTGELRTDRTYKLAAAMALSGFFLYNTVAAFERVEISADPGQVEISYRF